MSASSLLASSEVLILPQDLQYLRSLYADSDETEETDVEIMSLRLWLQLMGEIDDRTLLEY